MPPSRKLTRNPPGQTLAFRWRNGALVPVPDPHRVRIRDLLHIDHQKAALTANTRQFVEKRPANHALLTGARGTGKTDN